MARRGRGALKGGRARSARSRVGASPTPSGLVGMREGSGPSRPAACVLAAAAEAVDVEQIPVAELPLAAVEDVASSDDEMILDVIAKPGVDPLVQQTLAAYEEVFDDVPLGASWGIILGELGEAQRRDPALAETIGFLENKPIKEVASSAKRDFRAIKNRAKDHFLREGLLLRKDSGLDGTRELPVVPEHAKVLWKIAVERGAASDDLAPFFISSSARPSPFAGEGDDQ